MGFITLAEARQWLNLTDASEDDLLLDLIDAASTAVENYCNRPLASATVTEDYTGTGTALLFLRRTPVTAVLQVILAGLPVECSFDSISIRRADGGIFAHGSRVTVTYTGGWDPVPGDIKMATRYTLQAMRNAQAMDPNLMGDSLGGAFSGGYSEAGPGAVPRAARNLLNNYVARYTPS